MMLTRTTMALVAVLVFGSASAALAQTRPMTVPILKPAPCVTDEGQGRRPPCNLGGS
jgi:hypothetical protein